MRDNIEQIIRDFPQQFAFEPKIENADALKKREKFVVVGMGGSNLAPGLIKIWDPTLYLIIHKDYGLPPLSNFDERLVVLSSYSGSTGETIDAFNKALERELPVLVIAARGKLLEMAKTKGTPLIELPDIGAHPRYALGLSLKAMLKAMGQGKELAEVSKLAKSFDMQEYESVGQELHQKVKGKIPLIYSSNRNSPLAYVWKIKFNENTKAPAFYNVLPEINHNEMISFDVAGSLRSLVEKFYFIFLRDSSDDPRIQKRMEATAKILKGKGIDGETLELKGRSFWYKIFGSLSVADWATYYLAQDYGVDPDNIAIIDEFKKLSA